LSRGTTPSPSVLAQVVQWLTLEPPFMGASLPVIFAA
jgi:hypothetical protein